VSSSKTARLRRRQTAQHKEDKRLRQSGRVPQHTRAERRRAKGERQRQREAERSRQARLRRTAASVLTSTGVASFLVVIPTEVSRGHDVYPLVSAAEPVWPEPTELPHPPEPGMTFYTPWAGAGGTAVAHIQTRPAGPVYLDGQERYGSYGPNIPSPSGPSV
jgi:hypothetical protein